MGAVCKLVWFPDRTALRASNRIGMVFHNLREHVQSNRIPSMDKIMGGRAKAGMPAQVYLLAQDVESVVVAKR